MKIEIQKYRGFDIEFDTESELFDALSDFYDKQEYKKSFSAIKKWVDDFIKENQTFHPFYIESQLGAHKEQTLKVIGLRKDGRFVAENVRGEKAQISEYDEKDYYEVLNENIDIKTEYKRLSEEIYKLRGKRDELKMIGRTLKEIKSEIFNPSNK